jgi:hypothetical protein
MRHEPSDLFLPIQQTADQRSPFRRAKPGNNFSAGLSASCRGRSAAVVRRQQRTLRQGTRCAEATSHALLAKPRGGGRDAA